MRSRDLQLEGGRYVHICNGRKKSECVPVRFVAACKHGHLDDFPWVWFAHRDVERCAAPSLQLAEGATGDFSEIWVRCVCGAAAPLSSAQVEDSNPPCNGRRPWLGPDAGEDCDQRQRLLVRTASNSYFSQVVSALSVPEQGRELENVVRQHWKILKNVTPEDLSAAKRLDDDLRVAIAERTARPDSRVELVWTGPEAKVSAARDTAVVLRDLFGRAQRNVIVAGFSFTSGAEIFRPLFEGMRDRHVEASLFLHVHDLPNLSPEECARRGADEFLRDNWPFGAPAPTLYYDPRTVAPGSSINLHAKCVVIDSRWALVGSANFTHNAHARNIEAGVLIDDASFATALAQQWRGLIEAKLVLSLT